MKTQTSVAVQYARGLELQLKGLLLIHEVAENKTLNRAINKLARKVHAYGQQSVRVATSYAAAAEGKGKCNPFSSRIQKVEGKSIVAEAEALVELLKGSGQKPERKSGEVPSWLVVGERLYNAVENARTGEDGQAKSFKELDLSSLKGLVDDKELGEAVTKTLGFDPRKVVEELAGEVITAVMTGSLSAGDPIDAVANIVAKKLVVGASDFASGKLASHIERKSNEKVAKSVAAIADSILVQANTLAQLGDIAAEDAGITLVVSKFRGPVYEKRRDQAVEKAAPIVAEWIKRLLGATGATDKINGLLGALGGGLGDLDLSAETPEETIAPEGGSLEGTNEATSTGKVTEPQAAVEVTPEPKPEASTEEHTEPGTPAQPE